MLLSSSSGQDQLTAIPAVEQGQQDAVPGPPAPRVRPETATTSSPAHISFQPISTSIAAALQPSNLAPVRIATAVHSHPQGSIGMRASSSQPGAGASQPHPVGSHHPSNAGVVTPEATPPSFTVLHLNSADNSRCSSIGGASIGGSPHAGKNPRHKHPITRACLQACIRSGMHGQPTPGGPVGYAYDSGAVGDVLVTSRLRFWISF
jgi:hypothetical protein